MLTLEHKTCYQKMDFNEVNSFNKKRKKEFARISQQKFITDFDPKEQACPPWLNGSAAAFH